MTQEKATRFTISSHRSGYYQVSIPRLIGDHEVVKASDYDALLSEVAQLKSAIEAEATRQAYRSGLGVSEWEAFLWPEARALLGKER